MSTRAQQKTKQHWETEKPQTQVARQKMQIHDILHHEVERNCSEHWKEAGDSSGTSNATTHLHRQDTNAESCSGTRRRAETLSILNKGRLSLTKKRKANTSARIPKVYSRGIIIIRYTLLSRSAKPRSFHQ